MKFLAKLLLIFIKPKPFMQHSLSAARRIIFECAMPQYFFEKKENICYLCGVSINTIT
jgi:hypothetical protein